MLQNICSNMYSTEYGYRDEAGNPEPDKFVDSARFAGEDAKTIVQNVVIKDPSLMMQWMAMNELEKARKASGSPVVRNFWKKEIFETAVFRKGNRGFFVYKKS